jgi:AcrR family transcriptional regulator
MSATSARRSLPDLPDEVNRRQALIRESARLFREKGFDATTVRDIAAAVGMRSGSPFYHFKNKQEILKAVMDEGLHQGYERTVAALAQARNLRERFRALVRTHYGILHDEGSEFIAVLLYDWRSLPPEYKQDIIDVKDRYDALWQPTLQELLQAGWLGANSGHDPAAADDVKMARLMVMGAINFTATWYKQQAEKTQQGQGGPKAATGYLDLDALADRTVRFFMQSDND